MLIWHIKSLKKEWRVLHKELHSTDGHADPKLHGMYVAYIYLIILIRNINS